MCARDVPLGCVRLAKPRHCEAARRPGILDGKRNCPRDQTRLVFKEATDDPEDTGNDEPSADTQEVAPIGSAMILKGIGREQRSADLHQNVSTSEQQSL